MTKSDQRLFSAHAIFWVILFGLSLAGLSLSAFNKTVGPEVLWALFLLPPLEILSWSRARKMTASRARRYLLALAMMGTLFWIFALGWLRIFWTVF